MGNFTEFLDSQNIVLRMEICASKMADVHNEMCEKMLKQNDTEAQQGFKSVNVIIKSIFEGIRIYEKSMNQINESKDMYLKSMSLKYQANFNYVLLALERETDIVINNINEDKGL